MNGAVINVSGRDKNIRDQAMLAVTALVAQIMKSIWFTRTVHITAFRICLALFYFLAFGALHGLRNLPQANHPLLPARSID